MALLINQAAENENVQTPGTPTCRLSVTTVTGGEHPIRMDNRAPTANINFYFVGGGLILSR